MEVALEDVNRPAIQSAKLVCGMVLGTLALDYTLSLLAIFGGIGLIANAIIMYIVAQARSERRADEEWRERGYRGVE